MKINNKVSLVGVVKNIEFNHSAYGQNNYEVVLEVTRTSGTVDLIPIMISDKLIDVNLIKKESFISISGEYHSRNDQVDGKTKLILYVYANYIDLNPKTDCKNEIALVGNVVKKPSYRKTPSGREISDILIAVNRSNCNKSDYIPCISWGKGAVYSSFLEVGTSVVIKGRIQSREYIKKLSDSTEEIRIAYEVSISSIAKGDSLVEFEKESL